MTEESIDDGERRENNTKDIYQSKVINDEEERVLVED